MSRNWACTPRRESDSQHGQIGGRGTAGHRGYAVALFVDSFDLEEILVLELRDGRTEFCKLVREDYQAWLDDDFTTGELWQKNLLGGRP